MRKMLLIVAGAALLGLTFAGCASDQKTSSTTSNNASMTDTNTCKGCGMAKADCKCGDSNMGAMNDNPCAGKCDHCGMGKN